MFARAARTSMRTRDRRPPYLLSIVPMSVCTNLGPYRPSRLAAYAGCVMLRPRLRARNATRTFTRAVRTSMRTRNRRPH
jgi:hypothetical protein